MLAKLSIGIREEYPEGIEDAEKTLVHEMLHLHLNTIDKFKADSLGCIMIERAINHIARALVNIKREHREA